jgi:hypothetical protein
MVTVSHPASSTRQHKANSPTFIWPLARRNATEQDRIEKHGELLDWVESVLRGQYPDYLADRIRPCWPNHPEARWELACLYQLWSLAYLVKRPAPRNAADWHDRWSPGVIRRLSEVMSRCEGACQRQSDLMAAGDVRRRIPL